MDTQPTRDTIQLTRKGWRKRKNEKKERRKQEGTLEKSQERFLEEQTRKRERFLGRCRERLLEEQMTLREQCRRRSLLKSERETGDTADVASDGHFRDITAKLRDGALSRLQQIAAALARIKEGEYAVCMSCGGEIPEKRLNANPAAVKCLPCAEGSKETPMRLAGYTPAMT